MDVRNTIFTLTEIIFFFCLYKVIILSLVIFITWESTCFAWKMPYIKFEALYIVGITIFSYKDSM